MVPMERQAEAEVREPEEELFRIPIVQVDVEVVVAADLGRVSWATLSGRAHPVSKCVQTCRQGYPK